MVTVHPFADTSGPYADHGHIYADKGWHPLIPPEQKDPPPSGYAGHAREVPITGPDLQVGDDARAVEHRGAVPRTLSA